MESAVSSNLGEEYLDCVFLKRGILQSRRQIQRAYRERKRARTLQESTAAPTAAAIVDSDVTVLQTLATGDAHALEMGTDTQQVQQAALPVAATALLELYHGSDHDADEFRLDSEVHTCHTALSLQGDSESNEHLWEKSFHVFKNLLNLDVRNFDSELAKFVLSKQRTAGNIQRDGLRKQITITDGNDFSTLPTSVRNVLDQLRAFVEGAYPGRETRYWSILWSKRACRTQIPHYDYKFLSARAAEGLQVSDSAYSVMLATENGALLPIWEDENDLEHPSIVRFDRGDVVVFRHDVLHAGAPYANGHQFRIHTHLESRKLRHDIGSVVRLKLSTKELVACVRAINVCS